MHPLNAIALVAEEKIREAREAGAFDNLPGAGKPLRIEDDAHIPPDLRMAYTLLRNSGYLPRDAGKDAASGPCLDQELRLASPEEGCHHARLRRLNTLMARARASRGRPGNLPAFLEDAPYLDKLLDRVRSPGS